MGTGFAAIALPALLDQIRAAPVPEAIAALGPLSPDEALSIADSIRDLAWLALLGKARDVLAVLVGGDAGGAPGQRLSRVLLAGHVPVSRAAAI